MSPSRSFSSTTTTSAGTPPSCLPPQAAAEALSGPQKNRELARVILVRLRDLVPAAAAAGGSNIEHLAVHFTDALYGLLDGPVGGGRAHKDDQHNNHPAGDVLAAFQLLQDMSPYVKFGHFTANQRY